MYLLLVMGLYKLNFKIDGQFYIFFVDVTCKICENCKCIGFSELRRKLKGRSSDPLNDDNNDGWDQTNNLL